MKRYMLLIAFVAIFCGPATGRAERYFDVPCSLVYGSETHITYLPNYNTLNVFTGWQMSQSFTRWWSIANSSNEWLRLKLTEVKFFLPLEGHDHDYGWNVMQTKCEYRIHPTYGMKKTGWVLYSGSRPPPPVKLFADQVPLYYDLPNMAGSLTDVLMDDETGKVYQMKNVKKYFPVWRIDLSGLSPTLGSLMAWCAGIDVKTGTLVQAGSYGVTAGSVSTIGVKAKTLIEGVFFKVGRAKVWNTPM